MSSIAGTRVALVGAGAVNFGGAEGPWDHASRLEKLGAVIVAVVDPLVARAQERIDTRRANKEFTHVWANTEVYADLQDMLDSVKPTAVFIGVPPSFHGCYKYPLELQVLRAGAHLFLEKPLSNAPVDEVVKYAAEVEALRKEKKLVVSVGYMFRYSLFGEKIKELLQGKKPVCLMARYTRTYLIDHLVHGRVGQRLLHEQVRTRTQHLQLQRVLVAAEERGRHTNEHGRGLDVVEHVLQVSIDFGVGPHVRELLIGRASMNLLLGLGDEWGRPPQRRPIQVSRGARRGFTDLRRHRS